MTGLLNISTVYSRLLPVLFFVAFVALALVTGEADARPPYCEPPGC